MAQDLKDELIALALETLKMPRRAAERILSWQIPLMVSWICLILATILNAILLFIVSEVNGLISQVELMPISPFQMTGIYGATSVVSIFVLMWVGRLMGGKGGLQELVPLLTWIEFMRAGVQLVMMIISLILPSLSGPVLLIIYCWAVVILSQYISVAHGYSSGFKGFAAFVFATMALAFLLIVLFNALFGPVVIKEVMNV